MVSFVYASGSFEVRHERKMGVSAMEMFGSSRVFSYLCGRFCAPTRVHIFKVKEKSDRRERK